VAAVPVAADRRAADRVPVLDPTAQLNQQRDNLPMGRLLRLDVQGMDVEAMDRAVVDAAARVEPHNRRLTAFKSIWAHIPLNSDSPTDKSPA
jgi:hypothetical protein